MDISVVVPLYNEEESLPELFTWIDRVMKTNGFSYEVIFINDGSTDRSWQVIEELQAKSEKYGVSSSVAIMVSHRHFIVALSKLKVTW